MPEKVIDKDYIALHFLATRKARSFDRVASFDLDVERDSSTSTCHFGKKNNPLWTVWGLLWAESSGADRAT